ncbi:MAG: GNAT family N-acetyltransferase [Flavobacteriales bacterium]|nr:GNAT family N-acetyltransferase [Flavobacteriales bacterium]
MPTSTTLVPATTDDIPALLKFMEAFNAIDGYPFDAHERERIARTLLGDTGLGRVWMVDRQGTIAGYLVLAFGFSFEYGGRDAFIDEFHLEPEHRGKGVGTHVMAEVARLARELGVRTLHLEVEEHNLAGLRLYKRQGFEFRGRRLLSRPL